MSKTRCNVIQLRNWANIVGNGTADSSLTKNLYCTSKESVEISPTRSLQGANIVPKSNQLEFW